MAENKTMPTKKSVTQFLASVASDKRRAEGKVLLKLLKEVTGEKAVMWGPSIIGFGKVHYTYASGREGDMPAAGFSPRKTAHTFYISTFFDEADALFAKLGKHKLSKACLYVNKLEDVDMAVLKKILKKSYLFVKKKKGLC